MRKHLTGRLAQTSLRGAVALTMTAMVSQSAWANYLCYGTVSYLGVSASGDVMISVGTQTPIHGICSLSSQGSYSMTVPACKAAHAAIVAARLTNKSIVVYYNNEPLTCGTLPSWQNVPGVYFVQGPD